jgi:hypothetical protein
VRVDEWASGRMGEWTNGRVDEWTSGRMDEWTSGRVDEWTSGRVDEWARRGRFMEMGGQGDTPSHKAMECRRGDKVTGR